MYYSNLASYKDKIDSCKSFNINVIDLDGKVFSSSPIPIECFSTVAIETELVVTEGTSWSIWHHLDSKLIMFAAGTIRRIEFVFN